MNGRFVVRLGAFEKVADRVCRFVEFKLDHAYEVSREVGGYCLLLIFEVLIKQQTEYSLYLLSFGFGRSLTSLGGSNLDVVAIEDHVLLKVQLKIVGP